MIGKIHRIWSFLLHYIKLKKCLKKLLFSSSILFITTLIFIPIPHITGEITNLLNTSVSEINKEKIMFCFILLILLYSFRYILSIYGKTEFSKIQNIVISKIKQNMTEKYINIPMDEIEREPKGVAMEKIEETSQLSQMFSSGFIGLVLNFIECIFSIFIIATMSIEFLLLICFIIPIYHILLKKFSDKIQQTTLSLFQTSAELSGAIFQAINSVKEIKLLNAQDYIINDIDKKTDNLVKISHQQNKAIYTFTENLNFFNNIVNIIILIIFSIFIFNQKIIFSEYIILALYANKIMAFVQGFSALDIIVQPAYVALERIQDFLNIEDEKESCTNKKEKIEICKTIVFKNVYFSYSGSEKKILKNLSFSFSKNDTLWIKGSIGAGKSTIVKLIMGLYKPTSGLILINDIPIEQVDVLSLRERIAFVSQDILLFNDTIENNILLGLKDSNTQNLNLIIEKLELNSFFDSFEDGLNTRISKNSMGVSGGQAKVIALLRALLHAKDIIILDEFSANLDLELSRRLISNLKKEKLYNSLIVISHENHWDFIKNTLIIENNSLKKQV